MASVTNPAALLKSWNTAKHQAVGNFEVIAAAGKGSLALVGVLEEKAKELRGIFEQAVSLTSSLQSGATVHPKRNYVCCCISVKSALFAIGILTGALGLLSDLGAPALKEIGVVLVTASQVLTLYNDYKSQKFEEEQDAEITALEEKSAKVDQLSKGILSQGFFLDCLDSAVKALKTLQLVKGSRSMGADESGFDESLCEMSIRMFQKAMVHSNASQVSPHETRVPMGSSSGSSDRPRGKSKARAVFSLRAWENALGQSGELQPLLE